MRYYKSCSQGVALAVTTLVMAFAQTFPTEYAGCQEKAIERLKKVGEW